jgi:rfaE bifunctional protein kinase chain/domain/rfaE bifunctional protein nucleotidyltransferase chain/domain
MISEKILSLSALADKASELRSKGNRIVLCHGTFDLVHMGHIRHLQRAREEGDFLFVTVTADEFIKKGPGRPIFKEQLRAENLASLIFVDYVAICNEATAMQAIWAVKPDVYVKGGEYRNAADDLTGNISRELAAIESQGGRTIFTDEITFSSSNLLNEHLGVFPEQTRQYLEALKAKFSSRDILARLDNLKSLKVLVVGDTIVDQYCYTSVLGQTGKGNVLAVRYDSEEYFAGGAVAVANHVAGICAEVTLVSALGSFQSHEEFLHSKISSGITPIFFRFPNAPTVLKRRFVDSDMAKLFEVYFFDEEPLLGGIEDDICTWIETNAASYDLVLVPDFGNGLISQRIANTLSANAKHLVVNTQINSGNRGYHVINRYSRADAVSLNEPELRLAAHNRHDPLSLIVDQVGEKVGAKHFAVTRGSKGALIVDRDAHVATEIPAFSTRVVDRIGAGDAFLSFWGCCLAAGFEPELAGFVASVAAAIDVQIVCNREPVDPVTLRRHITTLLK